MTAFVTDTFTDTLNTAIDSHTGELGATWTRHALAGDTNHPKINSSNALILGDTTGSAAHYYASGVPASPEYTVAMDLITPGSSIGSGVFGVSGRVDTGASTGYYAIVFRDNNTLSLYKYVTGTLTLIGSGVAFTPATSTTYRLTLDMGATTALKVRLQRLSDSNWLNSSGTFVSGQTDAISQTDSAITAAGRAGIWIGANSANIMQMDNYSADEAGGGGSTQPPRTMHTTRLRRAA